MKWFTEVKTVEELRKRYRELLRKYHPDNGNGSTEITQQICGSCPEYLNSCMPVVNEGFLVECDLCYCEWCGLYDECMRRCQL